MSAWAAGPPKLVAKADAQDWALGTTVKLLTTGSSTPVEGQVFAADKRSGVMVLKTGDDVVVVSTAAIKEVVSRTPPPASYVAEATPQLDDARIQRRLDDALRAAEAATQRLGVGVTRNVQALFDALAKTHPCHWEGTTMVVLEEVLIPPPYTPSSCTGGPGPACERVRLVLQNERARLGMVA